MAWHNVNTFQGDLGTYKLVRLRDEDTEQASSVFDVGTMIDEVFWIKSNDKHTKEPDYEIIHNRVFPASLKYSSKVLKFPHIIIQNDLMCFVMPGQNVKISDRVLKLNEIPSLEDGIYVCYTKEFRFNPETHLNYAIAATQFYQRYLIAEVINISEQFENMAQSLYHPSVLNVIQENIKIATEDINKDYAQLAKQVVFSYNRKLNKLLRNKDAIYDLIYDIVKDV